MGETVLRKKFGNKTRSQRRRLMLEATNTDELFDNVSLLFDFTGTAGNGLCDCTDNSSFAHNITIDTLTELSETDDAQNKSGFGQFLNCTGNSDKWLAADAHITAFDINTQDYCIEWWQYKTGWNVIDYPFGCDGSYYSHIRRDSESYEWKWESVSPAVTIFAVNIQADVNLNTWQHMAITREGSTVRGFIDGQKVVEVTNSTDMIGANAFFVVGAANKINTGTASDLDDFRLTIGAARYTANFTPDSEPHPAS